VLLLDESFTGESSQSKRQRVAEEIKAKGAEAALISQLDSIAWLLNIRGHDVPRLPVLLGFGLLTAEGDMTLFTDLRKLPNDISDHVGPGVSFQSETDLGHALEALGSQGAAVMADPDTANAWCQLTIEKSGGRLIPGADPVLLPKAQKNTVEMSGIRESHIRDGAAVSKFLAWIDREVSQGRLYHEGELADQLEAFRRELLHIQDLSFDTISAAGSNAAMAHYNHNNGTPAMLEMNNLYLVDSGGQYLDGTTDITRTVIIGEPSDDHKRHFTLVLKGNIALSRARFPKGTSGVQLDALARQFLWAEGLNFDHGTGHGVGCFLSVHEGPQRISPKGSSTELLPGMVLSNEPGYYKENAYGIRCENLMAVTDRPTDTEYNMLQFEILTFAPFDLRLVDDSLMTTEEIEWLNDYHQKVLELLSPQLTGDDSDWLREATRAI